MSQTYSITCSEPTHAANSALPGWTNAALGTSSLPNSTGHVCPGCVAYQASQVPVNNRPTAIANLVNGVDANNMLLRAIVMSVVAEFNAILTHLSLANITQAQVVASISANLTAGNAD